MKVLSAEQTRQADATTIAQESISSLDLMERASQEFVFCFIENFPTKQRPVYVFCGPGNNGGDALAIARLLADRLYQVQVWVVSGGADVSPDHAANRQRWQAEPPVATIATANDLPTLPEPAVVIDGLFGSGLSRPVEGIYAELIAVINASRATVVAIDIPSGLFADQATPPEAAVVRATHTFTFQWPKLAFLLPQNQTYVGHWQALDIGLDAQFVAQATTNYYYTDGVALAGVRKSRAPQSHKGNYGKALLIAGSYGKIGAAVLSASACKRGGIGLLTVHVPECGYPILQTAVPEAMVTVDKHKHHFSGLDARVLDGYDTMGIGPGLGTAQETKSAMHGLLLAVSERGLPLVIDADALNICGEHRTLLHHLPEWAILTPHPKEFERLTEPARDDFHRLELLQDFCKTYQVHVVLKGGPTAVGAPDGRVYFNSTGNPGMATGGSGDVLTGLLIALLGQDYEPLDAARLGVYVHGLAGDLAAEQLGYEALTASDLVSYFGKAFQQLG
ncbi:MAG: NAD(P)H-hydrate dehydratase [Tunicatimonas sp.]